MLAEREPGNSVDTCRSAVAASVHLKQDDIVGVMLLNTSDYKIAALYKYCL